MKNWFTKKRVLWGVFFLFILYILWRIFFGGVKELSFKANNFDYSVIQKQNIRSVVSATGKINPVNVVSVGAQVSGIVDKIYID